MHFGRPTYLTAASQSPENELCSDVGSRRSHTQSKSQHPVNWKVKGMVKTNETLMIHQLHYSTMQHLSFIQLQNSILSCQNMQCVICGRKGLTWSSHINISSPVLSKMLLFFENQAVWLFDSDLAEIILSSEVNYLQKIKIIYNYHKQMQKWPQRDTKRL